MNKGLAIVILFRFIKLALIAIGILMLMALVALMVAMVREEPMAAAQLGLALVVGLTTLTVAYLATTRAVARRRAAAVLSHIEQAVRLNLPLPRIVRAIGDAEQGKFAMDLESARVALEQGAPLAVVLAAVPQMPQHVVRQVAVAERVGRLPQVLAHLMQQRRNAIVRGLGWPRFYALYPLLVGTAIVVVTLLLQVFVMPKFVQIFRDFNAELPRVTRITLYVSRELGPMLAIISVLLVILSLFSTIVPRFRSVTFGIVESPSDWILNRLPWIGTIRMHRALGEVLEFTAQAIDAGRPVEKSLAEVADLPANSLVRRRIGDWANRVAAGQTLAQAAREAQLPAMVSALLAPAMDTPDVAEVFRFLGRYYSTRFSRGLTLLQAAIVPTTAMVLGLFVGWVVLSIFAPLIALIQSVSVPASGGSI